MDVAFLSHVASRLVGERVTVYPDMACAGEARMSERGTWEITLHPDVVAGGNARYSLRDAFLHEVGHLALGHCPRQHITDTERAAARKAYAADMAGIMRHVAARERAADAWAASMAPVVEAWCLREHGMSFDAAARGE